MYHLLTVTLATLCLLINVNQSNAAWLCDGDPLTVEHISGALDTSGMPDGIPNSLEGTLPGDVILLHWRNTTLQLPRTNNIGKPSYTDGRWWWRVEDKLAPEFKERKGEIVKYECSLLP